MTEGLALVRSSVERLHRIVEPLSDAEIERSAYPRDWTIAQVVSHLGSGGVIHRRRVEAALGGEPMPDDFSQAVWDEWDAKSPRAQVDDGLAVDAAFLEQLESLTDAQRAAFKLSIGPLSVDFSEFVGLRVNEHGMHTWDVEVALDPAAKIPSDVAAVLVDNLDLVARFTGKPVGLARIIRVRTIDPAREYTIDLREDGVAFSRAASGADPDLELPAEAFARLVYGRLDPDHTPPVSSGVSSGEDVLATLRRVFPGP